MASGTDFKSAAFATQPQRLDRGFASSQNLSKIFFSQIGIPSPRPQPAIMRLPSAMAGTYCLLRSSIIQFCFPRSKHLSSTSVCMAVYPKMKKAERRLIVPDTLTYPSILANQRFGSRAGSSREATPSPITPSRRSKFQ